MKKFGSICLIFCCFLNGSAQSTASDNNTPPPLPPLPPRCIETIYLDQILSSFSLPCCIDTFKNVKDIAKCTLVFPPDPPNPNHCPILRRAGTVVFSQATLNPYVNAATKTETVTATCGGISLTALTQLVKKNESTGKSAFNINFASLENSLQNDMKAMCNGMISQYKTVSNTAPSGAIFMEGTEICCGSVKPCAATGYKVSGNVGWDFGSICHFPVFGCPFVISLDAVLTSRLTLNIDAGFQTNCTETRYCVKGNGSFDMSGRVDAADLPGFVKADLHLVATGGIISNSCFNPPRHSGNAALSLGKLQVAGKVSNLWGLVSHSISFSLFSGWDSPSIPF